MIEHISDVTDPARRDLLYGKEGLEVSRINEQINNCLAFELEFRSRAELKFGTRGTFIIQYYMAKVDLEYNLQSNEITVERPIKVEFPPVFEPIAGVSCPTASADGRIRIDLIAHANYNYNVQEITKIWVNLLFQQKPTETFTCPDTTVAVGPSPFWQAAFDGAYHLIDRVQEVASVKLVIVKKPEVYAEYKETKATGEIPGELITEVNLVHTPLE